MYTIPDSLSPLAYGILSKRAQPAVYFLSHRLACLNEARPDETIVHESRLQNVFEQRRDVGSLFGRCHLVQGSLLTVRIFAPRWNGRAGREQDNTLVAPADLVGGSASRL